MVPRCKAAALPRAISPVVATPLFGRLSSAVELCGQPSLSSLYSKLQSISLRDFSSIYPAVTHIPPTAKDDDAPPAAATRPYYMPEEWPDFSKKKVDPDVRKKFFNRMEEYDMVMRHLNDKPSKLLLLLGPINSGKSVSRCHRQLISNSFIHFDSLHSSRIQYILLLSTSTLCRHY